MADIVGRGEAYREVVRFIVAAEALVLDQGFGKVEGQFVPAMSLSLLKFVGQASLVDEAMLPS